MTFSSLEQAISKYEQLHGKCPLCSNQLDVVGEVSIKNLKQLETFVNEILRFIRIVTEADQRIEEYDALYKECMEHEKNPSKCREIVNKIIKLSE